MENRALAENVTAYFESGLQSETISYFDKIGFLNVGYWKGVVDNLEMAQLNLIETLVKFLFNTGGTVLDVACGKGASTKFLTKYFDPRGITGINISEPQLKFCRAIAPECNFKLMDAAELTFDNSSFDNVLCIEAGAAFMTRHRFFEEALRVLKPSGRMAMLDVLYDYDLLTGADAGVCPRENYLPSLDAYRESLLKVGFRYVRVDDCTDLTAKAGCNYVVRLLEREFGRTQNPKVLDQIRHITSIYKAGFAWGMIYAIK